MRIQGPDSILAPAQVILGYYGFEPSTNGRDVAFDIRVDLEGHRDLAVDGLDALTDDWFGCRVYGSPGETVVVRDRARLIIDKQSGRAMLRIDTESGRGLDASNPALFLFLTFALVHALQSHGRFILHGAAVCDGGDRGILILGESDTGKSTLTMSLIKEGWGYLSDDSLVVSRSDEGIVTKPFRTDFGLDPVAEEYFPGISEGAEPWLFGGDKWRVRIRELFPSLARPVCRPGMLVFPTIDRTSRTRLVPLSPAEAMVLVMQQGSFLFSRDEQVDARSQLDLLAALVEQCLLYRLVSGPDITGNAELLSRALSPRLTEHL